MGKNFEVFEEMLGSKVWIDSTAYFDNEVVELEISIYDDCNPRSNSYIFNSNKVSSKERNVCANLGCIPDRPRDRVIFRKSDISQFVKSKFEKWVNDTSSKNSKYQSVRSQLAQEIKLEGYTTKTVFFIYYSGSYLKIIPGTIQEGTLKNPFIVRAGGWKFHCNKFPYTPEKFEIQTSRIIVGPYTINELDAISSKVQQFLGECNYTTFAEEEPIAETTEADMIALEKELKEEVETFLVRFIASDYLTEIKEILLTGIIQDVKETSGFYDEGCFNEDDIRLAVGRVLSAKLMSKNNLEELERTYKIQWAEGILENHEMSKPLEDLTDEELVAYANKLEELLSEDTYDLEVKAIKSVF